MPTISHQARATIGGNEQSVMFPRSTVKASTGMNLPQTAATDPAKLGQPATTEETTAPAVTLSPQLTALARKQQKLQAEIQSQREKEAQWEKEKANYVPKDSFKAKAQQNAIEALQELGLSYDELTNLLLTQTQGDDPVKRLATEVEGLKKSQEESVNKQYENTLKQYRAETDQLVTSDPKAFHFINKQKMQDAVVQHIVETWKEDESKVLTVEQAAKEIEKFLREDAKEKADALAELEPKVEDTPAPGAKKSLPAPQPQAPKTLTRQVEASPTRSYGQFQHLSPRERFAQALARAQK